MTVKLTTDHSHLTIGDFNVTIRPISSDDEQLEARFISSLSSQSKHDRFFEGFKELSPQMLTKMCDIDYVNRMAYIATIEEDKIEKEIGVCRYEPGASQDEREMAITVADDYQHIGVGTALFKHLLIHARANCIKKLYSIDLRSNSKMYKFAKRLGMTAESDPDDARLMIYSLHP